MIQPGDLVSFDTDLVGRHGYSVDISRSWLTDGARATAEQRRASTRSPTRRSIHNIGMLRPGRSFREIADAAYRLPEAFVPRMNRADRARHRPLQRIPAHRQPRIRRAALYDGVLAEGMVLCVESYVGEPGGRGGVKLEEQVLITAGGAVKLSAFPFDERLLCDSCTALGRRVCAHRPCTDLLDVRAAFAIVGRAAARPRGSRRAAAADAAPKRTGLRKSTACAATSISSATSRSSAAHLVGELRVDERRLRAVVLDRFADSANWSRPAGFGVTADLAIERYRGLLHGHQSGRRAADRRQEARQAASARLCISLTILPTDIAATDDSAIASASPDQRERHQVEVAGGEHLVVRREDERVVRRGELSSELACGDARAPARSCAAP